MSKTIYIYSTLANDNRYAGYVNGGGDLPTVERSILIKGGAGVADKRADTMSGFVTEVTEEDLKILQQNEVFKRHVKNGFIFVSDVKTDPEKVVPDMSARDTSAPLVDADFIAEGKEPPTHSGKQQKKHR